MEDRKNGGMAVTAYGPNMITVAGSDVLLTATAGGQAVHLTRPDSGSETGRAAVSEDFFDTERLAWVPAMRHP
jgi:hypothetical protein